MRLLTFATDRTPRLGALVDGQVVDLNLAQESLLRSRGDAGSADEQVPTDVVAFLGRGDAGLQAAREALDHVAELGADAARSSGLATPAEAVRLLPPVPRPPKIICVGRNFAEHAREAGLPVSEIPIIFARFPATLVAHGDPVVRPTVSEQLDWEGELAVVIGKPGRHVPRAKAMEHVAGYSVFNDVTVRDYQFRITQYTAGKNFSDSGPFGPHLVLTDEVPDPHVLDITTEINDEVVQRGNTSDMIFDVPTIIEHISEFIALEAGDVIPMGTPSGVGFKRTPPRFLVPGDVVRVTVASVGALENPVVDEGKADA